MDRRTVLGLGAAALVGLSARSEAEDMDAQGRLSTDPKEVLPLWPGTPPGGAGVELKARIVERSDNTALFHDRYVDHVGIPLLWVIRPAKPDGSAVVLVPGGGYVREVIDKEGLETAHRLAASGVTCFMLRYRLPSEGWADGRDVPLQDAQRAIRLVRAGAATYGIDPHRTGILGFSAGGHVAASLATRPYDRVYVPVDGADSQDAKPSFAGLMYPVITMGPGAHEGSKDALLGLHPTAAEIETYSCEKRVTRRTPPTWISLAGDDDTVPPMENGVAMFGALHAAKVPSELHVFQDGKHGFGIRLAEGKPASAWPDLFLHWGYSNGWFRDPIAAPA